jgi:protein-S-isoprenylcysteine O-methyltransferase Ste14
VSNDIIFAIVYFAGLIAGSVVRVVYSRQIMDRTFQTERSGGVDMLLAALPGLGMIVLPLVYVLTSWLDWADYELPLWAGLLGTVLYGLAMFLLWRSHADLGPSFSPKLAIMEEHALVTRGVYRQVRHPMYSAHLLWALAQPLLLWNWIAGLGMLVFTVPLLLYRIPREEQMMAEHFGAAYRDYVARTGKLLPPWRQSIGPHSQASRT